MRDSQERNGLRNGQTDSDESISKATPTPTRSPTLSPTTTPPPVVVSNETNPVRASNISTSNSPSPVEQTANVPKASPVAATEIALPFQAKLATPDLFVVLGIVATLIAAGISTIVIRRYRASKSLASISLSLGLQNALLLKRDLIDTLMKSDEPGNIHGIGVGTRGNNEGFVVQVFVEDATKRLQDDPPVEFLPDKFRDKPIVIIEMPKATALTCDHGCGKNYLTASKDTLVAGTSIGNADSGYSKGTIGYFCEPTFLEKAKTLFQSKPKYVLSNAHVLAKLGSLDIKTCTCIAHPAPGESGAMLVADLHDYSTIDFDNSKKDPNRTDAAIATLNRSIGYSTSVAGRWKVDGQLERDQITHGMECKKFGIKTEDTYGYIYSLHLAIWVTYKGVGKRAFFDEQLLILPSTKKQFAAPGDSGSLVLNNNDKAIGLLFAGSELGGGVDSPEIPDVPPHEVKRIEKYGVANYISEVTTSLKVKLVTK